MRLLSALEKTLSRTGSGPLREDHFRQKTMNPNSDSSASGNHLFDLNALNGLSLAGLGGNSGPGDPAGQTLPAVPGLSNAECKSLVECFDRPACSETIFIIECFLNSANSREIQAALTLFGSYLKRMAESREAKSQEILASLGIYFSLFLRCSPDLNFYIDNEHFLVRAQRAYFPYIALYVVHFLVPAVIKGVNLNLPFDDRHEVFPLYADPTENDTQPGQISRSRSKSPESSSSPERSPPRRKSSEQVLSSSKEPERKPADDRRKGAENELRSRMGLTERMDDYEQKDGIGNRYSPGTGILKVPVINKIIDICPLNSPERRVLNELRRQHDSNPSFLITRLGMKSEKLQLALFLDDPTLVDEKLNEDDLTKAIFLHANRILTTCQCSFLPHHFDRAVECMNYEIAKFTFSLADWVTDETLDNLIFLCKTLRHAYCLEILKLVVRKKVTLCTHQIRKLPDEWRATIVSLYTTPRWRHLLDQTPVTDEALAEESKRPQEDRDATLDYYRLLFSSLKPRRAFLNSLQTMTAKLLDEDSRQAFVEKIKQSNQTYYGLMVSGYTDLLLEVTPTIVNEQDSYLNNILEIPRNFVIPCLEGTQLFLFDFGMARKLIDTGCNFYNRKRLSPEVMAHVHENYQTYNRLGLSSRIDPISDVLKELVHGRQIEEACACASNKPYSKKLVRLLRSYSVKESSLTVVNMQDLIVKLGMISIHLGVRGSVKDLNQLWMEIYRAIKNSDPDQRETLKRTIASLILVYSRSNGGYIISI
jgi:hypothetical protein